MVEINMSYFVMKNEELILEKTESLPLDLEQLYQKIRKMYVIEYYCYDWAEDTGDAGMGYDYDNSYEIFREPERREMVVQDGKLVGFYVGFSGNTHLEQQASKEYFLKLEHNSEIYHGGSSSNRYGNSKKWVLNIKEEPSPLEQVCLFWVNEEDREHMFTPEEFDSKFVEAVLDKCRWQDNYGRFDGAFRVTLKLTNEGDWA